MKLIRRNIPDEIPTSSTADIAFLLIVYFMVTTVFSSTRGLDFTLPKPDKTPVTKEAEESVEIRVLPDGSLEVDGKPMMLSGVLDYLKPKLTNNPDKPVMIVPMPETPYRYMVDVFDELRQAKEKIKIPVKNISIPTRRELEDLKVTFGIDILGG